MKKMFIAVFAMILAVISVAPVHASAQEVVSAEEYVIDEIVVSPCASVCPKCGGTITSKTVWGSWISDSEVKCTHGYAWGTDLIQKRTGTKTNTCTKCGSGWSSTVTGTRTVCHGYNKP